MENDLLSGETVLTGSQNSSSVTAPCKPDALCTFACKSAACSELGCSNQELQPTSYHGFPNTHICSSLHAWVHAHPPLISTGRGGCEGLGEQMVSFVF